MIQLIHCETSETKEYMTFTLKASYINNAKSDSHYHHYELSTCVTGSVSGALHIMIHSIPTTAL